MSRSEMAQGIRRAFRNPRELCALLGLDGGAKRQVANGLTVCCPLHGERTPSCSVTNGPDGTVRFRCFGCDASGDALTLIAAVRGLDLRGQFKLVLETAAEMAGLWQELEELRGGGDGAERPAAQPRPEFVPPPERPYPPSAEVERFWEESASVRSDQFARAELEKRGLDPAAVAGRGLIRVIPNSGLPQWARFSGKNWNETGHRMVVRAFDSDGEFRSVRVWRVMPGESPKRLPPGGHKASALVLANSAALAMLRGAPCPSSVVITEGEPDWLVRSMINPEVAVFGIGSGSWHAGFAARVPYGSEVVLRTHRDRAGDGYAQRVLESVRARAQVFRLVIEETEAA